MLFVFGEDFVVFSPPPDSEVPFLAAARSPNTENCLDGFTCVAYQALWTRMPEKCFLGLPT